MKNEARPESESPHEESIEILATKKLESAWITLSELIVIEDGRERRAKKMKIIQKKHASFFFPPKISACTPPLLRRRKSITLLALTN